MGTKPDKNGLLRNHVNQAGFNHMPKFVNERQQYVSPYHSDSAIEDTLSKKRKRGRGQQMNQYMHGIPVMQPHPMQYNGFDQAQMGQMNFPQMQQQQQQNFVSLYPNQMFDPLTNVPNDFTQPMNIVNTKAQMPNNNNRQQGEPRNNGYHCQSDSEILESSAQRNTVLNRKLPNKPASYVGDNWDRETVVTDATSNKSSSVENLPNQMLDFDGEDNSPTPGCCNLCLKPCIQFVFVLFSLFTPAIFIILPRILPDWDLQTECSINCLSSLLSFGCRVVILLVAIWAIFFRRSRATMPSVHLWRAFLLAFVCLVVAVSWIFYSIKIFTPRYHDYDYILNFSASVLDCLLFVHYLAVLLLEIKHLRKEFVIKVVRNTDGESRFYSAGHMSIQHCASWVLEQYYKDFPIYNPYLMTIPNKAKNVAATQYKLYNIDGVSSDPVAAMENSKAMMAASARNRDTGRNTRFQEEQDYDRRLRKRRARLIVAVEEAFMHIKRPEPNDNDGQASPMDSQEAAQTIFPSMARALQKYLRVSRQTHCYSQTAILDHLARCITLDFTPRAFLEKYLTPGPVITSEAEQKPFQNWEMVADKMVNLGIHEGAVFQLKQDSLSLVVYVAKLPRFYIREETVDPSQSRFVLRLQSETSV